MNAQLKAKWVEALRSGNYEQSKRSLRNELGFCCLGVLCDVMGAKWSGEEAEVADFERPQVAYFDDGALSVLGMASHEQEELYHMNDRGGKSFSQIADYIEEHL